MLNTYLLFDRVLGTGIASHSELFQQCTELVPSALKLCEGIFGLFVD
jgi:hypothetical protein